MTIINASEHLSPAEKYTLTRGANVKKMSEAVGSRLELAAWMIRDEVTSTGELMRILSVKTTDNEYFSTNSPVMIREFDAIRECFNGAMPAIQVLQGRSRSNRTYITCGIAE